MFKNPKGITLVSVIITVILILILAGITISAITRNGLIEKAEEAKTTYEQSQAEAKLRLVIETIRTKEIAKGNLLTLEAIYDEICLDKQTEIEIIEVKTEETSFTSISKPTTKIKSIRVQAYNKYVFTIGLNDEKEVLINYIDEENESEETVQTSNSIMLSSTKNIDSVYISDGTWSESEKVNTPKLVSGLIPIKFNEDETSGYKELTSDKYDTWYDYSNQHWANAITKNSNGEVTGYWVWIPRFAYKIEDGNNTNTAGIIKIKFLQGTTNKDEDNNSISTTYPTVRNNTMQDYVVHPSFIDGSDKAYNNGEWNSEISGYWVAKFPAGYAGGNNSVAQESAGIKYSGTYNNIKNYYSKIISGTTEINYPVFLGQTYAYNYINIGDSYNLALNLTKAGNIYNLDSSDINSHQMKNSEWGAVAYLSHSDYGYDGGNKIYINNVNLNNKVSTIYGITGYAGEGTNTAANTFSSAPNSLGESINGGTYTSYAWYTTKGQKGSSTQNITGIYDLSGCAWERVSGYITNKSGITNRKNYGITFAETSENTTGYQKLSSIFATVYPFDSDNDGNTNNWKKYKELESNSYSFGDAILETSKSGYSSNSWNGDVSGYSYTNTPFFERGGNSTDKSSAGIFSFHNSTGSPYQTITFRVVLIAE